MWVPARRRREGERLSLLRQVEVPRRPVAQLRPILGEDRFGRLISAASEFQDLMAGRTIWNVNSTAAGGGVAEMLQALVGYVRDLGVAIRWSVITGDAEFFALTK